MQCPVCNTTLLMGERLSLSIDYCPQCRGIWLAPGQLDALLKAQIANQSPQTQERYIPPEHNNERGHHGNYGHHGQHGHHGSSKQHGRSNWLRRLLD